MSKELTEILDERGFRGDLETQVRALLRSYDAQHNMMNDCSKETEQVRSALEAAGMKGSVMKSIQSLIQDHEGLELAEARAALDEGRWGAVERFFSPEIADIAMWLADTMLIMDPLRRAQYFDTAFSLFSKAHGAAPHAPHAPSEIEGWRKSVEALERLVSSLERALAQHESRQDEKQR